MSNQDLGVINDYPVKCGSFQLIANPSNLKVLTSDANGVGSWQSAILPVTVPNQSLQAYATTSASAQNFGNSLTPNFPFDHIGYNPGTNWSLNNSGTSTASLTYTSTGTGVFLVNANLVFQYNGSSINYGAMNLLINGSVTSYVQQVGFQPVTTSAIQSANISAVITLNSGDTLSFQFFSTAATAGDYVILPTLGGGNLSAVLIAFTPA